MGKVVFAWEFGGGFGHIEGFLPLAKALTERGHDVTCIMKYVINSEKVLGSYGIKILQAPVFFDQIENLLPNTSNYAENLYNLGYHIGDGLVGIAKAWRNLFDLLEPDLLIADHAPTALLASRGTSIKKMLYGTGYVCPPRQVPMPPLIPWAEVQKKRMEKFENKVLQIINNTLVQLEAPPLKSLADLFDVDETILATFKELDHYQDRQASRYWGPIISLSKGTTPAWPSNTKKKIFCYLKPTTPHFEKLVQALREIEAAVLIYAPNSPENFAKKYSTPKLVFLRELANMHKACEACDLVISQAGHGTVALTLLHGKPIITFPYPTNLEQVLTSRNVAFLKAGGAVVNVLKSKNEYKKIIEMVLSDPQYREQARIFADTYKDFKPEAQIEEITDRCEELMAEA